MNISIDVLIKEMVANEVALQLAAKEPLAQRKVDVGSTDRLTNVDGVEVVNPVDAEETTVDTSAEDQARADKEAKLAKRRASAAAKKAKEEADAEAEAEPAYDDGELDDDMCPDTQSPELSAPDFLTAIKKAIGASTLPTAQAKSMAKDVLSEDFKFDRFGDVPADHRSEVLAKVTDALS